jgi:ECF transporter S component (folate family)
VRINAKKIVTIALLIAMEIVLTRFLSIQTPVIRISFGFIPIAMIAMMYGPIYGGIGAALADLTGVALFPIGAFFPGFTLTAFLTGFVYGIFLHKQQKNLFRICAAVLIVTVCLNLGLDTLWIQILTGSGYLALIPVRIVRTLIMTPIQIMCIRIIAGWGAKMKIGGEPIFAETTD